jgi:hypothetical protein
MMVGIPLAPAGWGWMLSGLMRFHVRSEEGIDFRLISRSFGFKPIQDLAIQANGNGSFRLWDPEYGTLKECFALFRNIGGIDIRILEGINSCPVRLRSLFGSVLFHVCLPFWLK